MKDAVVTHFSADRAGDILWLMCDSSPAAGGNDELQLSAPKSRRNIELKAKLRDPAAARKIAEQVATLPVEHLHQVDTYFRCRQGRLKLREINGEAAQLIWYQRPDVCDVKASDYCVIDIHQPAEVKRALTALLGLRLVVEKQRDVYMFETVRIHFDSVESLGAFIEFEAVLGEEVDEMKGHEQVAWLRKEFGLRDADMLAQSYVDLLGSHRLPREDREKPG